MGSSTNLFHDPLERVIGTDLQPVNVREGAVGQGLAHAPFDKIGRRFHPGGPQVVDDRSCLAVRGFPVLLGTDGLELPTPSWERELLAGEGRIR